MITELPIFDELTFDERSHIYRLNGSEIPSVTTLMQPLSDKVYGSIDKETLSNAANKGTIVHNAIENFLDFGIEDIDSANEGFFDAFLDWYHKFQPVVIGTELCSYHKQLRYAGKTDLICQIRGATTIIDYKTTSAVNSMLCGVQLEGYARMWQSHGVKIDDRAILHLRRDGKFTMNHYPQNAECYSVLSSLITIRNYQNKF